MKQFDIIIVGAGAAGLSAAAAAIKRNKSVAILDMGNAPARKVAVSGGGKCNITNDAVGADRYWGENPNFVRSAISRVTPANIRNWARYHGLELYEKTPGRYFCKDGADAVVRALIDDARGATFLTNVQVEKIIKVNNMFHVNNLWAKSVVLATGGISFPILGVSDYGYKIAKAFGHKIVPPRPALCTINIAGIPQSMAGISLNAEIKIGKYVVQDSMLITHLGIGGPAAYRASVSDIEHGMIINMCPDVDVFTFLGNAKSRVGKKTIANVLSEILPDKVARWIVQNDNRRIADIKNADLKKYALMVNHWSIPAENIKLGGMKSAEVVRGGVATDNISSKSMESKLCAGLFFAGEIIDIAGDLGGFNLHWAWASGWVAGNNA